MQSAKVLGLVTAIFAFIGTWFCGDWLPLISTLITMLSFASAIFSMQQAGRCFQVWHIAYLVTCVCSPLINRARRLPQIPRCARSRRYLHRYR